jgi:hypothetical protein
MLTSFVHGSIGSPYTDCLGGDDILFGVLGSNGQGLEKNMMASCQPTRPIHSLLDGYEVKPFEVKAIVQESLIICESSPIR